MPPLGAGRVHLSKEEKKIQMLSSFNLLHPISKQRTRLGSRCCRLTLLLQSQITARVAVFAQMIFNSSSTFLSKSSHCAVK